MSDWVALSRKAGFVVEGERILVALGERRQQVNVAWDSASGICRLWSVAVPAAAARSLEVGADEFAWNRNRKSDLVGFRVDARERVIGEALVPVDEGLDVDEWRVWVLAVAQGSDRLEYLVTGRDEQ